MNHYIYIIKDPATDEFYYGSRSCECTPENDNYLGSYKTWKPKYSNRLVKKIIKDNFETREDALREEAELIKEHIDNSLNRNYYIPTKGFHVLGLNWKLSDSTKEKISNIVKERYKNKENNPMFGKHHNKESIQLMKQKAIDRYTIKWFIKKYGLELGTEKYIKRSIDFSNKNSGKNNPMYGKSHSNGTKNKISKSNSKKVSQFDINGNLIKDWNSLTEASEKIGISVSTINACCDPKRINKSGASFLWKYS